MSIPFFRRVRETSDGCAIFQCLDCQSQWESLTSPDTPWSTESKQWKFCPYCGVRWETKTSIYDQTRKTTEWEGRNANIPKWQWELFYKFVESNEMGYPEYFKYQDIIHKTHERNMKRQPIWVIESINISFPSHWIIESTICSPRNRDETEPMCYYVYKILKTLKKQDEEERQEAISECGENDPYVVRFCPKKEWRVRIFSNRKEFENIHGKQHVI